MKKLEIIEFLKGYAMLSIIGYHYLKAINISSTINKMINFGGTGIHLFILLSGLGLYLSHKNKPLSQLNFLQKRFTKIYFPYIFIVLISFILSAIIPIYINDGLYAFGGHVFLYKMFDNNIIGSFGYPLWFISMIIQFYLSFHFLTFMFKKTSNKKFVLITLAVSLLWSVIVILLQKTQLRTWNSFFLQYLWEFALGMVIANKLQKNNTNINLKSIYILGIGILSSAIFVILAVKGGKIGQMLNDIPALIGFTFIAIWVYQLKIKSINNMLIYFGKISFSLYLIHTLSLRVLLIFNNYIPSYILIIIAFSITIYLAKYYQKLINLFFKIINL